jgi:hypothetical protein
MPAAEQKPLAAVVQPVARPRRSSHVSSFQCNAKSPDVPGGVDIAMTGGDVSPVRKQVINCAFLAGLDPSGAGLLKVDGMRREI